MWPSCPSPMCIAGHCARCSTAGASPRDVRAICVATSPEVHERIERRWARFPKLTEGIELVIVDYDYRDILTPLVDYISEVNNSEFPGKLVTVVIPEFIPLASAANVLHNQTANILRRQLRAQEDVIVIDVPYHLRAVDHLAQKQEAEQMSQEPAI